ncbi:SDR family NAD(P)-dependent oxidoreductase [Paraburkholderia rhizosphaerae]|uniref:Short subunit dehydrogenase n=1 Tax=Paraburkholderia rhizosphaerae TaxID=480658 RepID=A0A4R8KPH7_9BURK|nr:SDR family NAD(P)-dependent oxidoreductase [Paraburkholderia rhizosphaerae]TDY31219.1 short subunit dehydrogenase [Paraburkholderia rhizosphaerae]
MDYQIQGKRALVSGSTKGIGFAIAKGLAREGAEVVINGRSTASVASALERLKTEAPNAMVSGFVGDLGNAEQVGAMVARHSDIDILVNNLGIFEPKAFESVPDQDWQQFFVSANLSTLDRCLCCIGN